MPDMILEASGLDVAIAGTPILRGAIWILRPAPPSG